MITHSFIVDTFPEQVGTLIFLLCWVIGILSWFYGVWEFIGIWRLRESAFRRGKMVISFSETVPLFHRVLNPTEIVTTKSGQFRFVDCDTIIFSERRALFDFRLHTPFPIKGYLRRVGETSVVEGKLPLGTTIFFLAWGMGFLVSQTMMIFFSGVSTNEVLRFSLVPLVIMSISSFGSIFYEIRQAKKIVQEIKEHFIRRAG